ncbi:MAG: peptidyl-prolyl cis-trans isomerase, EpsD family [Hydrogenophilales bacterium 17-64-11]|nr:MAG: peptidyl-prolyl cis-trans isomerase, EpsD family [Hydrogenophilales bacterium 16-62-9]OZA28057.1 MAG: peptidyl-prolyl cis-trans isomerase, EpsD family [Hydrogenophilales bacterium 17-64-11]
MKIHRTSFLVAVAALSLAACEQPATTAKDSIAATVDGDAISEVELGRAVARLGEMNAAEAAQARGRVLEALIDQHLVSHAAKKAKLDQAPEVALAMQQAQRQVLVEAYMERLFKDMARPADTEIQDYYARHPELFAQRKVYRIQELELQLAPARIAEVEAQLKQSRTLAEFADWLRGQGIAGKTGVAVKPAEQIAAPMLAQLINMKDGQVVVVPMGENRVSVLQLQGSQAQPATLEQARAAIERVVLGEKRKTLLEAEIRKLRASGKIEYASGFAPAPQTGKPVGQTGKP